ncbi:hypothetical protein KSP40_PGU012773 [Platanthera guangdongensis]|uniref:Uncharacterized protein n=1 Tax=Platanthera guangdongensis TaxID=2320717 RepID=A0ABR2LS97_9ASPA
MNFLPRALVDSQRTRSLDLRMETYVCYGTVVEEESAVGDRVLGQRTCPRSVNSQSMIVDWFCMDFVDSTQHLSSASSGHLPSGPNIYTVVFFPLAFFLAQVHHRRQLCMVFELWTKDFLSFISTFRRAKHRLANEPLLQLCFSEADRPSDLNFVLSRRCARPFIEILELQKSIDESTKIRRLGKM